jgi:NADPH-dependent curcumin reductase CurA
VTDGKGFGGMQKVAPGTPPNLALSLLGVNGLSSYFGMVEIGKIKAGETVVVSGAAGATGSVAGQIAKIKGCRVIGTAGGKDKCAWLVNEAHFEPYRRMGTSRSRGSDRLAGRRRQQAHAAAPAIRRILGGARA